MKFPMPPKPDGYDDLAKSLPHSLLKQVEILESFAEEMMNKADKEQAIDICDALWQEIHGQELSNATLFRALAKLLASIALGQAPEFMPSLAGLANRMALEHSKELKRQKQ